MGRFNDPAHLPRPLELPTLDDLNEGEDEAYERHQDDEQEQE